MQLNTLFSQQRMIWPKMTKSALRESNEKQSKGRDHRGDILGKERQPFLQREQDKKAGEDRGSVTSGVSDQK